MTKNNYRQILQVGVLFSILTIFFVFSSWLFPYVSSKQIIFNISIEALLPLWFFLIWRYKEFRPSQLKIGYALILFLLAILISSFVSFDFNLSFWGDAERMLGWFHLSHYFLFYFYLITAFRNEKEWRFLLGYFVALATILAVLFIFGDNRLGNTAYFSGFILFAIYFAYLLFLKIRDNWRYLALLAILPMLIAFVMAKTSGAIIALASSILVFLFLLAINTKKRQLKRIAWISLIILTLSFSFLISQSNKEWYQNHSFLRILSFDKPTFQTRLISWEAALIEFPNNPILGVGYGNYGVIFNKQFDSKFLDYTRSDTFFDRAHNNIIDITATVGIVGLLTYLSIFLALLYYMRKLYIKEKDFPKRRVELILLFSLLVAYFVQNLAIFDTQTTYLGLMIFLAYITYLAEFRLRSEAEIKTNLSKKPKLHNFTILLVSIFSIFLIFSVNVKTASLFRNSIDSYKMILKGEVEAGLDLYEELLKENTSPIRQNVYSIYLQYFTENVEELYKVSDDNLIEKIDFLIEVGKKNLAYNPIDTRKNLQLSQFKEAVARLDIEEERANEYRESSKKYIKRAIESSPNRAPLYLNKAQVYLGLNEEDLAIEAILHSISLNPNLADGYCHLSQVYYAIDNNEEALNYLDICVDKNGLSNISLQGLLIEALQNYKDEANYLKADLVINRFSQLKPEDLAAYLEKIKIALNLKDKEKAILAGERFIELEENFNDISVLFIELSNLKLKAEKVESSVLAAEIAATLNPELEEDLREYIKLLKQEGFIE